MVFRFGERAEYELDEEAYELRRAGQPVHLEPKVLDLLLTLVRARGQLVTKDEIFERVWAGTRVVESALTRAMSLARQAVGDDARAQSVIETVSGRGYRWRAPVDSAAQPRAKAPPGRRAGRRAAALLTALAAAALATAWLTWPRPFGWALMLFGVDPPSAAPPLPDEPSIAVLPFEDLGSTGAQKVFARGLTEDVTSGLARFSELFVIASSSASAYAGQAVDLRKIGRELGVRYAVQGNVRADTDQLVATVQLTETQSSFLVWSGRFEQPLHDRITVQNPITDEILDALGVKLRDVERERVARGASPSPAAYGLLVQAREHWERYTREGHARTRELLQSALAVEPRNAEALSLLAATHVAEYSFGWDPDPAHLELALKLADQAQGIDSFLAMAHTARAGALLMLDRPDEAVASARRAVELGPNNDMCYGVQSLALAADGQLLGAIRSLRRAMRLSPRQPSLYWMLSGYLYAAGGRSEEAARVFEQVRDSNPDLIPPRVRLAAHYASARPDLANVIVAEILRVNPAFTGALALRLDPARARASDAAALLEGLRLAGLPPGQPLRDAPRPVAPDS